MAYATAADLLLRKDWREIGDLVSDDTVQISESELTTDAKVLVALSDASGDINASLLAGGRYTVANLESLTGDSLALLKRITCEIGIYYLLVRRPNLDSKTLEYYEKLREMYLRRLSTGEDLFNLDSVLNASLPDVDGPTSLGFEKLNLLRDRAYNYYPRRHLPNNR